MFRAAAPGRCRRRRCCFGALRDQALVVDPLAPVCRPITDVFWLAGLCASVANVLHAVGVPRRLPSGADVGDRVVFRIFQVAAEETAGRP